MKWLGVKQKLKSNPELVELCDIGRKMDIELINMKLMVYGESVEIGPLMDSASILEGDMLVAQQKTLEFAGKEAESLIEDFKKINETVMHVKEEDLARELREGRAGKWVYLFISTIEKFIRFLYYSLKDASESKTKFSDIVTYRAGVWIGPPKKEAIEKMWASSKKTEEKKKEGEELEESEEK